MICQHCKKQISDTSKFCPFCGKPVAAQPQPVQHVGQPAPQPRPVRPTVDQPTQVIRPAAPAQHGYQMSQGVNARPQNPQVGEVRRPAPQNSVMPRPASAEAYGRPAPAPAPVPAPVPVPVQHTAPYGHTDHGRFGVADIVKSTGRSPIFIVLASVFSLTWLISIFNYFVGVDNIGSIPGGDVMSVLYTIVSMFSGVPVLLTVIALLLIILAAFNRRHGMSTAGFSMLRGITIYNIVLTSISAFFTLIGMFMFLALAFESEEGGMIALAFLFFLISIGVYVFLYFYYIKILGSLGVVKSAVTTGEIRKNVSMFVAIILFISAFFTFVGMITKIVGAYEIADLIYSLTGSGELASFVYELFNVSAVTVIMDILNIAIPASAGVLLVTLRTKLARFVR